VRVVFARYSPVVTFLASLAAACSVAERPDPVDGGLDPGVAGEANGTEPHPPPSPEGTGGLGDIVGGEGGIGGSGAVTGGEGGGGGRTGAVVTTSVCEGGTLPPLQENRAVYASANLDVWTVRITADDAQALADVNNDVPGAQAAVVFQEDSFGAEATAPNAIMEVRGRSTRLTIQKSFQITLDSKTDLWRGNRRINLNKHPYDLTRVRNKLAFDLFQTVPNITSLQTQFVHLLVNGQDYGLFTQIEAPEERFLAAHKLDPAGTLYKAGIFTWRVIDDATANDPVALAKIVEAKANPDLPRLNRMLRDVLDTSNNINDVMTRHFNRQNYMTWLAANVLFGNMDTGSSNWILYSPSGCDAWYFLPWDYDGSMEFYQQPGNPEMPRWRTGLSNWWSVPLHQRFLRDPDNVRDLTDMIETLSRDQLSDANVMTRVASYHDLVRAKIAMPPDLWNLPTFMTMSDAEAIAQWEVEYGRLGGVVGRRYAEFRAVMGRPMPIWLYTPVPPSRAGEPVVFSWSPSYHLQGGGFSYDLEVSATTAFAPGDLVVVQRGLRQAIAMVQVPPGTYYWRVITRADDNPAENWQEPFSRYQKIDVAP